MKKIVLGAVAAVLVVVLLIGTPVWWKLDRISYENELLNHFAAAIAADGVTAEYNGVVTRLNTTNTERLRPYLTRTERELQPFHTRENTGESITIRIDADVLVEVEQPDPGVDLVYIYYTNGPKHRTYSIEGYDTMRWMKQVVSPEGMYGPNAEIA